MNWETSVLNKLHKSNAFKLSADNLNNIKDKPKFIQQVNDYLKKYDLNNTHGLRVNSNGAIYKLYDNKRTKYFSYKFNHNFYLFCNFFDVESQVLQYSSLSLEGLINSELRVADGRLYADSLKKYLLKLMFTAELNKEEFLLEVNRINKYLEFKTVIIGNEAGLYDVVLLSILSLESNWVNREAFYKEHINIRRWFIYIINLFNVE
jgi:hypothetical protein